MSVRVTAVQSYSYSPLNSMRGLRSIVLCARVQHLHSPGLHWQLLMNVRKRKVNKDLNARRAAAARGASAAVLVDRGVCDLERKR